MLHAANQPRVPEATPVPGFEKPSLLVPMKLTTQDIAAGKDRRSFFMCREKKIFPPERLSFSVVLGTHTKAEKLSFHADAE